MSHPTHISISQRHIYSTIVSASAFPLFWLVKHHDTHTLTQCHPMKEMSRCTDTNTNWIFFKKTFNLVSRLSKLPRYWIEKVPLTAATAVRMFVICAHREWGGKKEEEAWSKEGRNTGSWRLFSDDQRALSDTVWTSLTWRTWGCCTWQIELWLFCLL